MIDAKYETVIGLEVHAHLLTASKMYCSCSARYIDSEPNSQVCPVCLGLPGALPVINQAAVDCTIMMGLALNCEIPAYTKFDRKNYSYPDLVKGYQISQYDKPLCQGGWLEIEAEGERARIGITRAHLEEDVAKMVHVASEDGAGVESLIDLNRSGMPLIEIVSEPDLRTPEQARQYLIALRDILRFARVGSGNMEDGSFRCDANVSLRRRGESRLGAKVEIKNLNSFRAVHDALAYEQQRQAALLDAGAEVLQETRGWDDQAKVTQAQRSKEYAHDYRYFPDPDLPPLHISREQVAALRARLPELAREKRRRYAEELGLPEFDVAQLTSEPEIAAFFEATLVRYGNAKVVSNWLIGEVFRLLNAAEQKLGESRLTPDALAALLQLLEGGELNAGAAKTVLAELFANGGEPSAIASSLGLRQQSDSGELRRLAGQVLAANEAAVADYRAGKQQAFGFLLGQVMKASKGTANPKVAGPLLRQLLDQG